MLVTLLATTAVRMHQHRANRVPAEGAAHEYSAVGTSRRHRALCHRRGRSSVLAEPYLDAVRGRSCWLQPARLYWVVYAAIAYAAFRWERRKPSRVVRVTSPKSPNPESADRTSNSEPGIWNLMCGIAGIIRWNNQPVFEHEIRSMCRMMVHRGPDEEGIYVNDGVALGMRRLSIIDLEGGQQPVFNEDRSICVVFNGEIYNYQELHEQLVRAGHTFRTDSDTETIVHLYEDYGARCVDHLRGMFAFAIWDMRHKRLLLARDRLGIKPLYYAETDGGIAFASELKPILALPEVDRTVNWQALSHLFTFLATPASQSIINGVKKLEPARLAVAERGSSLRIERYWDVEFEPDEISTEGELIEQLREVLADSVAAHEISDVPVGAFLSGGIDSSAVVATMAARQPGRRIKTFSIGFAEDGFDELVHARKVAKAFGTEHHELVLKPDVVSIVEDLAWYLDEPFGDTSAIPTYMVSKLAAEHVKVVLTGDGGDELFAGYDKYVVERREREYDRVPAALRGMAGAIGDAMPEGMKGRRFLRHLALDGPKRYLDASTLFRSDEMEQLFQTQRLRAHLAVRSVGRSAVVSAGRSRLDVGRAVLRPAHVSAARHPDEGRPHDHGALD